MDFAVEQGVDFGDDDDDDNVDVDHEDDDDGDLFDDEWACYLNAL